jgi:hypothetical protein
MVCSEAEQGCEVALGRPRRTLTAAYCIDAWAKANGLTRSAAKRTDPFGV